MKITAIETYFFEYPLEKEFHPSWIPGHAQTHNRCVIIKVVTDDGLEGVGAASCFSEDQARVLKHIAEETIGLFLMGGDPQAVEVYSDIITRYALMLGGRPWLLEVALWDLIGKAAGLPLYRHWGGERDTIEIYASTGETNTVEHSPAMALAARDADFGAIKLRAHHMDMAEDIRALEAVREAVGDSMRILVDANQGWSLSPIGPKWDYNTALEYARACEACDVYWLEEPLDRFDFDGLARLRSEAGVRIAGGEMNQGLHEFKILLEKGSLDVYQPDATLAGGVIMAREVAAMAEEQGLWFSPHTWTNGIGFAVNAQIAAACGACPVLEFPWEPSSWSPAARDAMLTAPFTPDHGTLRMPDAPGLGIELDPEAMSKYAKRI